MNWIYIIEDQAGHAISATYEEDKAKELCRNNGHTYRLIPFTSCEGTKIIITAGPLFNKLPFGGCFGLFNIR